VYWQKQMRILIDEVCPRGAFLRDLPTTTLKRCARWDGPKRSMARYSSWAEQNCDVLHNYGQDLSSNINVVRFKISVFGSDSTVGTLSTFGELHFRALLKILHLPRQNCEVHTLSWLDPSRDVGPVSVPAAGSIRDERDEVRLTGEALAARPGHQMLTTIENVVPDIRHGEKQHRHFAIGDRMSAFRGLVSVPDTCLQHAEMVDLTVNAIPT